MNYYEDALDRMYASQEAEERSRENAEEIAAGRAFYCTTCENVLPVAQAHGFDPPYDICKPCNFRKDQELELQFAESRRRKLAEAHTEEEAGLDADACRSISPAGEPAPEDDDEQLFCDRCGAPVKFEEATDALCAKCIAELEKLNAQAWEDAIGRTS